MRGIACGVVVLLHTIFGIIPFASDSAGGAIQTALQPFMVGGVDLFFVLSGFLIGGILIDNKGASNFFRAFWTRRIARIFPVYFLLFFSFVGILAVRPYIDAPWLDIWLLKEQLALWTYATFTQNFAMALASSGGPRWIGITWSLAVEEQFYLLLPPLVYLLARRSLVGLAVCGIVAAPIIRSLLWTEQSWFASYVLLPGRMDTLMFGVLATCIVRSPLALDIARRMRTKLDVIAAILAASVAFGIFDLIAEHIQHRQLELFVRTLRYSALAAFYGIAVLRIFLVAEGPYRRILRNPLLVHIGLISYAFYMYHQAVNGLAHGYFFGQAPRISSLAEFLLALSVLAVAYTLSRISMTFMERPIRRRGQQVKYRRPAAPQPVAPPAPAPERI
ncbi:acyltransferase 3 [Parvibaculum lavamentivorans DS-1]|uniref:Acyltransferase 3 n=1 Tax=Parvibaculum lavamentivorans (strain DS-1 / DSM 13023 / NCIMB 13966) TaxID=402881 RepID=A7HYC5_PARL1|nr:acyltransferase [Parvibaculum lavamentivorans]ABS64908.1 acyltransferase 3 [Parvibaculum lavamentivorans DS-1]